MDYKLRMVPDADSGHGAAENGLLAFDYADVGSGNRTVMLAWDTPKTPSGTYVLRVEAVSHTYASGSSASQRCVVTLTRAGEIVPELDAAVPILVSRTDGHVAVTLAGPGLGTAHATLSISTLSREGTKAAATELDLDLPGYGAYHMGATVRRPHLKELRRRGAGRRRVAGQARRADAGAAVGRERPDRKGRAVELPLNRFHEYPFGACNPTR